MKLRVLALLSPLALAACNEAPEQDVVGPEDYEPFGDYFTMDESSDDEMTMDGGEVLVDPKDADPHAALLAADALPDDKIGATLTEVPKNSPAVR